MNVLVTGGAGYSGTVPVHALAASDWVQRIVIYDNLNWATYSLFLGLQQPVSCLL